MYMYLLENNARSEHESSDSIVLLHEKHFKHEEFESHCREAKIRPWWDLFEIEKYLIENKGYSKPNFAAEVDISEW